MSRRKAMAVWVAILALTAGAGLVSASHKNGCYQYANYLISWYNGGTGDYFNIYNEEAKTDANAWDPYTDVSLSAVASAGTTDHINAYNGSYGATGWLVLTEMTSVSGCTVLAGRVRLNQTYLDNGSYTRDQKKIFACQGIGRLLGLSTNTTGTTCMNGSASFPNTHDRDVINATY